MSAIELAIRAESKKFLSSPLVVQVLENIWSGKIVTSIHDRVDGGRYFIAVQTKGTTPSQCTILAKRRRFTMCGKPVFSN